MIRHASLLAALSALLAVPIAAHAQEPPPEEEQIAEAVQPLPEELRDGATVLGRRPGTDGLVTLREGSGDMICISDDPADAEQWHVACYHESLSAFMERGRELRARGANRATVDSVRAAEAVAGELPMPEQGSALYSLTGPPGSFDASARTVSDEARKLFVLYMPWATEEATGLPRTPKPGEPWLMDPGKPWAHIMLVEPPPGGGGG